MRKVTWFVAGTMAGAGGMGYARKRVARTMQRTAQRLSPTNLARRANAEVRDLTGRIVETARQRGTGLTRRATLMRADRDGRVDRLEHQVNPGDAVLVDGEPVEAHRVVVVRRTPA